jgi:hypothetical protein
MAKCILLSLYSVVFLLWLQLQEVAEHFELKWERQRYAMCGFKMAVIRAIRAIRAITHSPDDGGSKDLCNVGKLLLDYTALQPRRQPS